MYKEQFRTKWNQTIFTKPKPSKINGYIQENLLFKELSESHVVLKEYYDISNWDNNIPKSEYESILSKLGAPTHVSNKPNGFVIWQSTNNLVIEHIMRDEQIYNNSNYEFLYTTVKLIVSNDDIMKIINLSKSITIDLLKNTITVRSNSLSNNMKLINNIKNQITK
jgi:hypothetical protein